MVGENLPAYSSKNFEMCPVLGSPLQERHGVLGAGPTEGKKEDLGTGTFLLQGMAEVAGCVEPQEEMAETELINVL